MVSIPNKISPVNELLQIARTASYGGCDYDGYVIAIVYSDGGSSWRAPLFAKHYEWSKEYYISPKGLKNISIKGDEFYFVSLQLHNDIAYIYPCKNFELDKSLNK